MSTNDMISRLFNMKRYPESESKESIRVVAGLAIDALEKQQAEIERLRAALAKRDSGDERDAALGRSIQRACGELPEGFSITIDLAKQRDELAARLASSPAAPPAAAEGDLIEKIVEYGGHRENEGGSYATFQKSEARRHRAEADEVLEEIRAMLAAKENKNGDL